MRRTFSVFVLSVLLLLATMPVQLLAAGDADQLTLESPAVAERSAAVAVLFRLPKFVAAVDGRILVDTSAVEVTGLAPVGGGLTFRPEEVPGGVAFGAYGLRPTRGRTVMRVVFAPLAEGQLQYRIVIDAAADKNGQRLTLKGNRGVGSMRVGEGGKALSAPNVQGGPKALRPAGKIRDLAGDGKIGDWDLDIVRTGWELARVNDAVCGSDLYEGSDANGDGCVDIVDVQAVYAAQGQRVEGALTTVSPVTAAGPDPRHVASLAGGPAGPIVAFDAPSSGPTFVVDSTADSADVNVGDGICADLANNCTLRAALQESNWWPGPNRIEFNLPGTAPVRIQLSTEIPPHLNDRSGGVFIDGYSQPGSRANTAAFGSNAIPGVELRGNASSPRGTSIRIHSPNNTIRGIVFNNTYRPVVLDGADANNNRIIGNWLGFTTAGAPTSYRSDYPILVQNGAHHNYVGTPDLADRNVSGNGRKGTNLWGAGTNYNVIQNNLFCTAPNGATAYCNNAVDLDHGPKHTLVGGLGPNERNISGRTTLNGLEMSHGFSPDEQGPGTDPTDTWQINNNRFLGNWLGFRLNGSYDAAYRSAQNNPGTADNGNGINVYDGSNFNLVEGNYVASVWDGIQTMSSNSTGNVIRNNIIGESPLGEAAPVGRWGIVVRLNTRSHTVEGNIIRNAAAGGIGLTQHDVRFIRLTRNIVTGTTGPAIHLQPNPSDPTIGANNLQAPPVINSATTIQVSGTGVNGATVEVYRADRLPGESGLPIEYLGSTVVSGGTWSLPVSLTLGDRVTALQIPTNDNTSTLAVNVAATFEAPPDAPTADFTWGQQAGSLGVNFTDTSTGSPSSWSWNFGDGTSSTQQNPTKTYSAAGEYTVTMTATNAGGSDDETQTVTVDPVEPPSGGFIAADAFSRTVSGGWGNADIGGSYTTTQGPSGNYSVSGGTGNIVMPSANTGRSALLDSTTATDVDLRFRVKSDKVPTGGNSFIYAVVRRNGGNNEYRPRLILNANGSVSVNASVVVGGGESAVAPPVVVAGLTQSADSFIWMRAQVTGSGPTTIRVKAWADGQSEPSNWNWTATNNAAAVQTAGSLGLRTYVNTSINNAPITFSFDDYSVAGPAVTAPTADFGWTQQSGSLAVNFTDTSSGSPTSWSWNFGDGSSSTQQNPTKTYAAAGDYTVTLTATNAGGSDPETKTITLTSVGSPSSLAADAFGRNVSNGWGTAETGGAYTLEGTASNFGVSGGTGNITMPVAGANRSALLNGVSGTDVDIRFRVRVDKVASGNAYYVYGVGRRNGTNAYRPKIILNPNGSVAVHAGVVINNSESSVAPSVVVPGLTQTAGSFIWVRAQLQGTSPTTIRVKAWADGQVEPSTWDFTATNNAAAVQTAGGLGLRVYLGGSVNNAPVVFSFDDYSVVALP